MKYKKILIVGISAAIVIGILLPVGIFIFGDNDKTYTQTLQLDGGAKFTMISSKFVNCSVISNPTGYPEHFILNLVAVDGSLTAGHTANITFYSPAGFGEHDHIGIVDDGAWVTIPAIISGDGKNISAIVDHTWLCNPISVLSVYRYPELEILLEVQREDSETLNLTRNTMDQILLPLAMKNITYHVEPQAQGGNGTYFWEVYSGSLPNGLDFTGNGILSGNATEFGNFTFGLRVSSADYIKAELFNLTIADYLPNEMLPTDPLLPPGYWREPYVNDTDGSDVKILMGGGNSGLYTIYLKSGTLPNGTIFSVGRENNYAYAKITGYTNAVGTFNITIAGYDAIYANFETNDPYIGNYIERQYTIQVSA